MENEREDQTPEEHWMISLGYLCFCGDLLKEIHLVRLSILMFNTWMPYCLRFGRCKLHCLFNKEWGLEQGHSYHTASYTWLRSVSTVINSWGILIQCRTQVAFRQGCRSISLGHLGKVSSPVSPNISPPNINVCQVSWKRLPVLQLSNSWNVQSALCLANMWMKSFSLCRFGEHKCSSLDCSEALTYCDNRLRLITVAVCSIFIEGDLSPKQG